jgi:hypothetical protein
VRKGRGWGDLGPKKGRFAHKIDEKSQKIETNFETLLLILNMVRVKNRVLEGIKSLLFVIFGPNRVAGVSGSGGSREVPRPNETQIELRRRGDSGVF